MARLFSKSCWADESLVGAFPLLSALWDIKHSYGPRWVETLGTTHYIRLSLCAVMTLQRCGVLWCGDMRQSVEAVKAVMLVA